MVHDQGELLALRVSTGEGDARAPVVPMAAELWGPLSGERGSISKVRPEAWLAGELKLMTWSRRTMKPRLRRLWDRLMLRSRSILESSHDQIKHVSQIEHSRHRSLSGVMVNVAGALIAYTYQSKKPSLGLWHGDSGLPAVA